MKIIITNDDGIQGEGLHVLANWVKRLGDVTIFAPKFEQSGKSHGIELHKPFEVKRVPFENDISAYTVDSTPADCVRYALLGAQAPCDLLISGINRGMNLGRDILYSGTVGAAFEAVTLGVKALAISTDFYGFDAAKANLDKICDYFLEHRLYEHADLYNVNVPNVVTGDIRITHQGGPFFADTFDHLENDMVQAVGRCVYEDRNDLTYDTDAVMHGHISIMPLTTDRTDWAVYRKLTGK